MRKLFKFITVVTLAIISVSCSGNQSKKSNCPSSCYNTKVQKEAKYIFYFIGDGMAAPQILLGEAALAVPAFKENYYQQTNSKAPINKLRLREMPIAGMANTNAENRYITGSAAAATALATGHKTYIDHISVTSKGEKLRTMAEMAKDKGMKVGVVSSVSIDHATPACFYAHTTNRRNYSEISNQLLNSGFDYFAGGSPKWDKRAASEKTDLNTAYQSYRKSAEDKGFQFITSSAEFDKLGVNEKKPIIATLDMLSNEQYIEDESALPYIMDLSVFDNIDNQITLADFTAKGAEVLNNDKGFFLMVESGKIDWACHANDATATAYEVVAFDEAIGVALDFAKRYPEETLIVVTGDHDCGGLTIGFAGTGYETAFEMLSKQRLSYKLFSETAVSMMKSCASFDKLFAYTCDMFGFTNLVTDGSDGVTNQSSELSNVEVEMLKSAYAKSLKNIMNLKFDEEDIYLGSFGGYDPYTTTCTHILNNKAGVDFTSYKHTAVPVPVFAMGVNQDLFSGYYDNTDIAKKIMQAANLK